MTVINNQPGLTPKDYPDFDSKVGNSFASSIPDEIKKDDQHLDRITAVSDGLLQIYQTVVADAAAAAPMTPQDSAIIANTVANMTASVGVESMVVPIVSLESRYSQHMGYVVTQESLGKTFLNTVKKFMEVFIRLVGRIIEGIRRAVGYATDKARPLIRLLNTTVRLSNLENGYVQYTPSMSGILVDGQIPAWWFKSTADTLELCSAVVDEQKKVIDYANSILAEIDRGTGGNSEQRIVKLRELIEKTPALKLDGINNSTKTADAVVSWTGPLSANSVGIRLEPLNKSAIDAVNYGVAIIPIPMAPEFGITTKYNTELVDNDTVITISSNDYAINNRRVTRCLEAHSKTLANTIKAMDVVDGELKKVAKSVEDIFDTEASDLKTAADGEVQNPTSIATDLLTYATVARSVVSGAYSSIEYTIDIQDKIVTSLSHVFTAFNKKAGR